MEIMSKRLRALRESALLSQVNMADILGIKQASVNRYENNQAEPKYEYLLKYADYFDVSLDYLFGRTDNPQGMSYNFKPKLNTENEKFKQFIEMCFDPESPLNERLKQTLFDMVKDGDN